MMGGIPAGGQCFGAAYNPDSVMPTSTMIDLIQGGGLDATVLGCAEVRPFAASPNALPDELSA